MRKYGLMAFTSLLALNAGMAMAQNSGNPVNFQIKSQPVGRALNELAQQAGIQVIYTKENIGSIKSAELKGTYHVAEALDKLLAGRNLGYQFVNNSTVAVRKIAVENNNAAPVAVASDAATSAGKNAGSDDASNELEEIVVNAKRVASSATKFQLNVIDTPQSIKAITADIIDFASIKIFTDLDKIDASLSTEGFVNGRPFINFRGFEANIPNGFMVDGIPSLANGPVDLGVFERIEIIKGPSSTIYGQNMVGGMINAISKRPTSEFKGSVEGKIGSWDYLRVEGDVGGPLTQDGRLSFRGYAAHEEGGQFVDYVINNTNVLYGALKYDLDEATSATVMVNYQDRKFTPDMGRPISTDNTMADVPASRLFGPTWAESNIEFLSTQAEVSHKFANNWTLKVNGQYARSTRSGSASEAFGLIGPNGDVVGLNGAPISILGYYDNYDNSQWSGEVSLTGDFDLFGRSNTFFMGVDHREASLDNEHVVANLGFFNIINPDYAALNPPRRLMSDFGSSGVNFLNEFDITGGSLQLLLHPLDRVSVMAGMRFDKAKVRNRRFTGSVAGDEMTRASSAASDNTVSTSEFVPQIGVTFEIRPELNLYANYGKSFIPQSGTTFLGNPMPPEQGRQYEGGIKGNFFDKRITATLAYFDLLRSHITANDLANPGFSIDTGTQTSRGVEADVFGNIMSGWSVYGSFAYIDAKVESTSFVQDIGARVFNVPKYSMSLYTTYKVQKGLLSGLGLGAGVVSKQDRVWGMPRISWIGNQQINPGGYTTVDLRIFYELENIMFDLKANNVFDEKYYTTAAAGLRCCIYPGRPREFVGSVKYKF